MAATTLNRRITTKKPKLSLYLPDELKESITRLSEVRNRSVNNLIETVLRDEVKRAIANTAHNLAPNIIEITLGAARTIGGCDQIGDRTR